MYAKKSTTKYVAVCGAGASAIGKGITVSSVAALLKAAGYKITVIKIDPYLNIDAGTMSPYEHGEVYVLDDGGEADLDLGNYERFLNINLTHRHNITTGKVYQKVLASERKGQYLGKTVQIVPHITDAIIEWIRQVADVPTDNEFNKPEICLLELGGTVGDIESSVFLEALRQLNTRVGHGNMTIFLVSYVPVLGTSGQPKTKPSQHGFKELRYAGLTPDFIVSRSTEPLEDDILQKLSLFSGVPTNRIINIPDLDSVYKVPLLLNELRVAESVCERLGLEVRTPDMSFWRNYYIKDITVQREEKVTYIAFVGKYVDFEDAYLSVQKAFAQASIETGIKIHVFYIESEHLEDNPPPHGNKTSAQLHEEAWKKLRSCQGVFVPGGYGIRGTVGKMLAIQHARENKIAYFGVCYGMQLAVIEFCRNVLKWNAITEEHLDSLPRTPDMKLAIVYMPEISKEQLGGTMRVGSKRILIDDKNSWAYKIYGQSVIYERHRHRYEVNTELIQDMINAGLNFSASDETRTRMEVIEIPEHPFFFATQFHPELRSRLEQPAPPFIAFVLAAGGKLDKNAKFEGGIIKNFLGDIKTPGLAPTGTLEQAPKASPPHEASRTTEVDDKVEMLSDATH